MNDDGTPRSSADDSNTAHRHHNHYHRHDENNYSADDDSDDQIHNSTNRAEQQEEENGSGSTNTPQQRQQRPSLSKKAKDGLFKKLQFLHHLLMNLDTVIYIELCTLYYMDCSFIRLMLRWAPQWLYLSPKPEHISIFIPNYPIGAIVGPNVLCMLLHLIFSPPQTSEASRGYLHGGILIDFIGQKAPTSKLTFLLLDIVVLCLQCFMLIVSMEKDRIKKIVKPPRRVAATNGSTANTMDTANTTGQDHDHEERGVLRDAHIVDEANSIEMQSLGNSDSVEDRNADENSTLLDGGATQGNSSYENLQEVLASGNAVLADFHVRHALQTAWNNNGIRAESTAAYALQSVGYNATLAALAAQRRARLAAAQATVQTRR